MKKLLLILFAASPAIIWSQCTVTNATDCVCLDGTSECDLIPDITASYDLLAEPDETVETPGELRLSVGTPNIGHGPLKVLPTDNYVCGLDTIYSPGGLDLCPDGTIPHQIINQRIYHKSGDVMTYWDRNAGTMTYHPAHGHFHTDNWGIYTLRTSIDGVDDPLAWPIVGYGTKLGFCLMDLANCSTPSNYGYCREDDGTVITNDIDNYGLGGGNYNCDITKQGISVGYLDIYDYYLDGMSIDIPEGVCNGDYMIVVEIDPNHNYIEESDDNNVIAVPITLTEQPEDVDFIPLSYTGGTLTSPGNLTICSSEGVEISAAPVGTSYLWSTGETTSTITITEPGDYSCYVERVCGPLYTDTLHIEIIESAPPVVDPVDVICAGTSTTITATAVNPIDWYDAPIGGTLVGSGTSFTTPDLFESMIYYAESINEIATPIDSYVGEVDHEGSDYTTGSPYNGYLIFDAVNDFTLESVKVITDYPGVRTIELRDATDAVLQSLDADIPDGTSIIDLNFDVAAGTNYHLGTSGATNTATFGDISPRLKRSDSGTSFPYTIDGVVNVTGTSYDESRWYYFYDWHVAGESIFSCPSERVSADVEVNVCNGVGDITEINYLNIFPNPSEGNFNIGITTETAKELTIQVADITRQLTFSKTISNVSGEVNIPVHLTNNAQGIYQVTINVDGKTIARNIVVE